MIPDLVQDLPGWICPLRGNDHKPSSALPECTVWADWMILYTGSFFLILPLHVPAAESVPEGMQSGQLLQAGAPAAGEGTGEQQPHHRTETEGRLRSGRCHCCGECMCVCLSVCLSVCVCVCVKDRQTDRGRKGKGKTVLSWFYRLCFQSPHFTSSIRLCFLAVWLFCFLTLHFCEPF